MNQPLLIFSRPQLIAVVIAAAVFAAVFHETFGLLYSTWQREEYSHGFLVPLVSAFLIWQRRDVLERMQFEGSWAGVALVVMGLALKFVGSIASIAVIDAYALVVVIAGCLLAVMGWKAFKVILVPVALLLMMVPMPAFFYNTLSAKLQLISSQIGVAVIRLFGISVYLEGNVIDLGTFKLQVVEACSGLRYLFPLMTLGVLAACFFKGKTWMRWCIFLSTVPITVLMNSFRIGVIGVLVDNYGSEQAEGFLHDFEGWVVFMACFALLLLEVWVLMRLSRDKRPFREVFGVEFPPPRPKNVPVHARQLGSPAIASAVLLLLATYPAFTFQDRAEATPVRREFAEFPLSIGEWQGRRGTIEQMYLDILQLDDYILADYTRPGAAVNFYAAYYASQRGSQSAHSPRSCLPGGGWEIAEFDQRALAEIAPDGSPLRVNRVLIRQGNTRQLVYYWFQQRGREITNEYLVKWYLLADGVSQNRSDGALVRLTTPLRPGEDTAAGDERLAAFARESVPMLGQYIPD